MEDEGDLELSDMDGNLELDDDEVDGLLNDREEEVPYQDLQISRTEWEALPPTTAGVLREMPAKYVLTAFTGTNPCWNGMSCLLGIQNLQKHFMEQEQLDDLPYNFLIGGSGLVFECRGWNQRPILPEKYSNLEPGAFLIGFFGTYKGGDCITSEMVNSRINLIKDGMDKSHIASKILYYQCIK